MRRFTRFAVAAVTIALLVTLARFAMSWYVTSGMNSYFVAARFVDNWRRLRIGMSLHEVEMIFGEAGTEIPIDESPLKDQNGGGKVCYYWKAPSGFYSGKQATQNEMYVAFADGKITSTGVWGPSLGMIRDR